MDIFSNDYKQEYEYEFKPPYSSPGAKALIQTRDGGIACSVSEIGGGNTQGLLKLDANGKLQWWTRIEFTEKQLVGETITSVAESPIGGYMVVGITKSHDMLGPEYASDPILDRGTYYRNSPQVALLVKVNSDGTIAWKKAYGELQQGWRFNGFANCMAVAGGYILHGYKDTALPPGMTAPGGKSPANAHAVFPWLVKVDEQGQVLWETLVTTHAKIPVYITSSSPKGACLFTPYTDKAGNIYVGYAVENIKFVADGSVKYAAGFNDAEGHILLMKFSPTGQELARYEIDQRAPVLYGFNLAFASGDGSELVWKEAAGLRRIKLNAQLQQVSSQLMDEQGFYPTVAQPGPNNSWIIAGRGYQSGSAITIAQMLANGQIVHRKVFERYTDPVHMVYDDRTRQVVVTYGDGKQRMWVRKFKLQY